MSAAASDSVLVELDIAFHEELIESQHNELFTDIFKTLRTFSYDLDSIVHSNFTDKSEIMETHRSLMDDIKSNNAISIIAAVKAHNAKTIEMYRLK